jgi:branched-chain amino acid transport system permease protein
MNERHAMEFGGGVTLAALGSQLLVGLSRAMILFIVCAGLSFILGVLRVPNIAHGSLYMIGAFSAYSISTLCGGGSTGFWLAEYLSVLAPRVLRGSISVFGSSLPRYNLFLLIIGPLVAIGLWFFTNKTKIGKISRAAAVDREMVGVVGINVSWVFAGAFVLGCFLAGLGGALVAPTVSISLGMDHDIIIEAFLIVTIGGLGNIWGALVGSLIFGLTHSFGVLLWPQFAIVFPYAAVVIVLLLRPRGLLKSVW